MKLKIIMALVFIPLCFGFVLPSYANDMHSFESSSVLAQITKTVEELNRATNQLKNLADDLEFKYQREEANVQNGPVGVGLLKKQKDCERNGGRWSRLQCHYN